MDILCQAKSGMGKTAVFVLATLQQIEPVDGQVSISMTQEWIKLIASSWIVLNMSGAILWRHTFAQILRSSLTMMFDLVY